MRLLFPPVTFSFPGLEGDFGFGCDSIWKFSFLGLGHFFDQVVHHGVPLGSISQAADE
jgi:hypothetical protein